MHTWLLPRVRSFTAATPQPGSASQIESTLGAANRTEAVTRARQLGLIS